MKHLGILCAALLLAATHYAAFGQPYPNKPIRIIVPFPAGENTDVITRLITQRWSAVLGQNIIVDNRAGATGIIGVQLAAKATPDGYVLLMGNMGTLALNPGLYKNLPYNVLRDFVGISQVTDVKLFLFVSPASLFATSVKDLIAYAKAHPGQVNFASTGVGGAVHLAGELFKSLAKIDIVNVPYKGAGFAVPDLLTGKVHMMFYTLLFHSFVKEGKLRALVIAAAERSSALPEVPTSAEIGMPELRASSWQGVVAPAGIPAERAQKLYETLATVMADRQLRQLLLEIGSDPVQSTPEEFSRFLETELDKWLKVIQFSGAKVE